MHQVRNALLFLVGLVLLGTVGYMWIVGWSILDSASMTVITISTVGYREIAPLFAGGKLFTGVWIILGVGTLAYAEAKTTEALLERGLRTEGEFRSAFGVRQAGENLVFNPPRDLLLETGDSLPAPGQPDRLRQLEGLADRERPPFIESLNR